MKLSLCIIMSLLLLTVPFFGSRIETIKNLLYFAAIVFLVAASLGFYYGTYYIPIFFALVYVGAVTVSTLMVVLTFDLRAEYTKVKFHAKFVLSIILYYSLSAAAFSVSLLAFKPIDRATHPLTHSDILEKYMKCLSNRSNSVQFCTDNYKAMGRELSFIEKLSGPTSDIHTLSSNFYTTYALLFIVLAVLLTMALIAALSIIKKR